MSDHVDFPGEITVTRESGYDAEGNMTVRVEVRTLISYARTMLDNNNQMDLNSAPGFRLMDLAPDILSMMRLYHEHRSSNPCKCLSHTPFISESFFGKKNYFLVVHSFNLSFADDFNQICQLYHHEDGFILPNIPNSLFKFDDFEYEEQTIEDFYFSVPRLLVYR